MSWMASRQRAAGGGGAGYVFASYAREDYPQVAPIVSGLKSHGIETWVDTDELQAGMNWHQQIYSALMNAIALLLFVSPQSMGSASIREEILAFRNLAGDLPIPVILEGGSIDELNRLSPELASSNPILLTGPQAVDDAVKQIAAAVHARREAIAKLGPETADQLANLWAEDRALGGRGDRDGETPSSIFVVHGHDMVALEQVTSFLAAIGVEPLVLHDITDPGLSLLQKFLTWSKDVRFAVVVMSADDLGASRFQFESPEVADRALQFRSRQNVIFELGFFYGYLGWESVFLLYSPPDKGFPNFEIPSDLAGITFDELDSKGSWKDRLRDRLRQAGFEVRPVLRQ